MSLEMHLAVALTNHHMTLATAESCTGGGLSQLLTTIPGASAFFVGGIIAYQNDIKIDFLGVPSKALELHGAVSAQTATAMAEGCRIRFKTDLAVSITGIAGPSGGSPEKPVGLVYIAVASREETRTTEHRFSGDRHQVREHAIASALRLILEVIENKT
jgi:PncC family amidohydrolase